MSAIARLALSPRLSMAAARSLRPATVQASSCCPPPPPSLTLTLLPSSLEPALPPSVSPVRSWNWLRLRLPHHRIRQEPLPEAAAVLLRHSWLCPLRGHGTLLSYDGFPPFVRLLNTGCVECRHLAPEERLLFLSVLCC